MSMEPVARQAREFMGQSGVDGWLVYDYRGMNPIFGDTVGRTNLSHVTRPVWLWIPTRGAARMLVSFVDQSRFTHLGLETALFVNRRDMVAKLRETLGGAKRVGDGVRAGRGAAARVQGGRRDAGDGALAGR